MKKSKIKITNYVYNFIALSRRNEVYKRSYRNLAKHIENFEKYTGVEIFIDKFNTQIAEEFLYYLRIKGRINGKNKNGSALMQSSVCSIFDKLKAMLKRAQKSGFKICDISEIDVSGEDANTVYLDVSELNRLNEMKNLSPEMAAVRDRFLLGCFTAMRFSDYSKLTKDNIIGNNIVVKTRKSGEKVVIPIHPVVNEVLRRNGGDFPKLHSAQAFNTGVKRLCKKAKINNEILYERTLGNGVVRKRVKKYELISSHTARRSGATNMYLAGIPTARIMMLTGHKTEQSFFRYIRIEKEENAKTLSEHSFFK